MEYEFPAAVKDRIRIELERGAYRSAEEVILDALDALEARERAARRRREARERRPQTAEEMIIERAMFEAGLSLTQWGLERDVGHR